MKPKSLSNRFIPRASFLVGTFVFCQFTSKAVAATFIWDGNGTGATGLDVAANWNPNTLPSAAAGSIGQFDGSVTGNLSLTVTTNNAATSPWSINVAPGQDSSLTLDSGNTANTLRLYNITIDAGAFENASAALSLGDGTGTGGTAAVITFGNGTAPYNTSNSLINNSASPATIKPDVVFGSGGATNRTLTFDGSGTWNVNAPLGITVAAGNGSIGVIKTGGGALNLNAANTFTTGLTLNQGTLNLNNATALGAAASTLTIAGGTIDNTSGSAKTLTNNNPVTLNSDFAYSTTGGTNNNDLSLGTGVVSLGTAAGTSRTITANGSGILSVGGVIANGTTANSIIKAGTGNLRLDGTNTYTGGTTLSAGQLHFANNAALGTGTLTINGGTVVPRIASRTISNPVTVGGDFTIGLTNTNNQMTFSGAVNLGGVTRAITVFDTTLNPDAAISGVISNGGLTKSGGGTLILSAANTFSGPTTVSQGILTLSNSTPLDSSSSVTINGSGAKLILGSAGTLPQPVTLTQGSVDGNGTISSLTVADAIGNTVAAGNGANVPLTVGSLTFQGAATFNMTSSGPFSGQELLVTNLATSASADVVVNPTSSSGVWLDNTDYNLIEFANYPSAADASHFTLVTPVGLNPSQHASLVNTGTTIVLRITTDAILWTGAQNSDWTTVAVGGSRNWTDNGSPVEYANSRSVIFDDFSGVYGVNIAENISPSSVIFNNESSDYTVTSSGGFGILAGSLTKSGPAKVTLTTNNSYTGSTTVNSGTLEITGSIASSSSIAIATNGTLSFDFAGAPNVYANPITGSGSVNKNGVGALTLTGANTFTGNSTLNAGTLNFNGPSALGAGPGALVINGGTLDNTSGGAVAATANKLQTWNADVTFTGSNNLDMGTGTVTLANGDRTVSIGGVGRILTVGEIKSAGSIGLTISGGTLVATSIGTFGAASSIGGTLTVSSGATLQINRSTGNSDVTTGDFVATGLAGSGTITNGAAVSERSLQINTTGTHTFAGTIANGGAALLALNKQGTGTLTLTGSSSYSGPTVVGGGILDVRNSNALGNSHVSLLTRLAGIQLQGGITIPSAVTFLTSNDGTGAGAVGYAIANVSGDNTINGVITMTSGAGSTIIQSDSGTLTLAGNVTSDQTRTLILQGASNAANTLSGVVSNGTAGTNALTKIGAGTWTLTGTNTYTGVTTISEGTLQLGNGTTDGTIGTTSGVVNNAALVYNWATNHTAGYVISGSGSVTKNGAGTATLTGVNTYTGTTTVNAGELAVNGTSIVDAGTVVINGGKANLTGSETVDKLFFGGVQQPAGTYTAAGDATHFSGAGTLIVTSGPAGFSTWASANGATGQTPGDDHDGDGVSNGIEFFIGATGTTFTALPSVVDNAGVKTVTWSKSAGFTGAYQVQVSSDLSGWSAAPGGTVTDNGTTVVFTFPAGPAVRFIRLVVTPS